MIPEERSKAGDVHCMPADGTHECSSECWCEPEVDFVADNDRRVWLHRESH